MRNSKDDGHAHRIGTNCTQKEDIDKSKYKDRRTKTHPKTSTKREKLARRRTQMKASAMKWIKSNTARGTRTILREMQACRRERTKDICDETQQFICRESQKSPREKTPTQKNRESHCEEAKDEGKKGMQTRRILGISAYENALQGMQNTSVREQDTASYINTCDGDAGNRGRRTQDTRTDVCTRTRMYTRAHKC